jgi:mono/diheme cytochrome c family protein
MWTTMTFGQSKPGECPQARLTQAAPAEYLMRRNPYAANADTVGAGKAIYLGDADTDACALCHGKKGDGKGGLAKLYDPPPRNFTCGNTMSVIGDGQLFWVIRYGSTDTGMPPHRDLSDKQIWQLVAYVRQLAVK